MTARERMIWITTGCIFGLALVYNLGYRNWEQLRDTAGSGGQLHEARRLLGAEPNIMARERAVTGQLNQLQSRFYRQGQARRTKLELLRLVEDRAAKCGLDVQLKNAVVFSEEEIGVSLEGIAGPETIVRFLQQITVTPIELKLKRIQLHGLPEQKALNYRISVSALVVE